MTVSQNLLSAVASIKTPIFSLNPVCRTSLTPAALPFSGKRVLLCRELPFVAENFGERDNPFLPAAASQQFNKLLWSFLFSSRICQKRAKRAKTNVKTLVIQFLNLVMK